MTHPVTSFTGHCADLLFEDVAALASWWGYDGLGIAFSGDHLNFQRAAEDVTYLHDLFDNLDRDAPNVFAISNHLTGHEVCDDPIDIRPQAIVDPTEWGDGKPDGVRPWAADKLNLAGGRAHARRRHRCRVHRFKYLAVHGHVPAGAKQRHRGWPPGLRRSLGPDPCCL